MRYFGYIFLQFGMHLLYVLLTSPIVFGTIWCNDYCDAHVQLRPFKWALIPVVLIWLLGLLYLPKRIARHMALEDESFVTALKLAISDLRIGLAFLPVVGHWFEPNSEDTPSKDEEL